MYKQRSSADGVKWFVILTISISVTLADVSDPEDRYPLTVERNRTDPSLFVKHPNVLDNVSEIRISRIRPSPKSDEIHIAYGTKLDKNFRCRETNFLGGKFITTRRDLPGGFKCGERSKAFTAFVIPTIRIETGQIFNVSLDFIKLNTTQQFNSSQSVRRDLPLQLQLSSGIMFLSGLFVQTKGSLTIAIEITTILKHLPIKIRLEVVEPPKTITGQRISIELEQNPYDVTNQALSFNQRLKALQCISHTLRVASDSFRQINFIESVDGHKASVNATYSSGTSGPTGDLCHDLNSIHDHIFDDSNASDSIGSCTNIVVQKVDIDHSECGLIDEELDTENPLFRFSQSTDSEEQESQDDGSDTLSTTTTVAASVTTTTLSPALNSVPIAQNAVTDQSIDVTPEQSREATTISPAAILPINTTQLAEEPSTATTILVETTATEEPSTELTTATSSDITTFIETTTTMFSTPNIIVNNQERDRETTPSSADHIESEDSHFVRSSRKKTWRMEPVVTDVQSIESKQAGSSDQEIKTPTLAGDSTNSADGYHYGGNNSTNPFLQKTEVYGITALACVPLIVVFVIIFYKMAKCKKRGEYDPIQSNCSNGLTGGHVLIDRADSPLPRRDSRC